MRRRNVTVVSTYGVQQDVCWYEGASSDSVRSCIRLAFGVPPEAIMSMSSPMGTPFDLYAGGDEVDGMIVHLEISSPNSSREEESSMRESNMGLHRRSEPVEDPPYPENDESRPLLALDRVLEGRRDAPWEWEGVPDPKSTRSEWVDLKRILSHLANERTYLAWVRVGSKMFSLGLNGVGFASKASRTPAELFFSLGMLYIILCPFVIFLGLKRFEDAAQLIVQDTKKKPELLVNSAVRHATFLLAVLTMMTLGVMVLDMLFSDSD
ncbi:unnamed protein product [Choristocarpus tenellus]